MENYLPLHECNRNAHKLFAMVTRPHMIIHAIAIAFMLYYRCSFLFLDSETRTAPLAPWLIVFAAELLLSILWLISQVCRWTLVSRTVFPERLPPDDKLPPIDVFIFTADPTKEPTVGVMNTVISAMALDYPADKLHVYLSDDGGAAITLHGMREARRFARYWIQFCRRFGIKTPCPHTYFSDTEDDEYNPSWNSEFVSEKKKIQEKYEMFKEGIERTAQEHANLRSSQDHPPLIEVIRENNEDNLQEGAVKLPTLVYVSREKRPSRAHNFKAGAINAMLRVSGLISNAPYVLLLDCDMHCNDSMSARQAMCFYLDRKSSSSLAFVQFPQLFSNVAKNDIYDTTLRYIFMLVFHGLDAVQGPLLVGTNFFLNRKAIYGNYNPQDVKELKSLFGHSSKFIKTLQSEPRSLKNGGEFSSMLLAEAKLVASSTYEHLTTWGKKVGFSYHSVVEDCFTGFHSIHCKGWRSVYFRPSKPAFLGTTTTNLNDLMIQNTRWGSGMAQMTFSRFCPLFYAPFRTNFLQWLCYSEYALIPFVYPFSICCFAVLPQLCLLHGIPLYPEISNPFFLVFPFLVISAISRHLFEVLYSGGDFQTLKNECRMWTIKAVTSNLYGAVFAVMESIGIGQVKFLPTNKIMDDELVKRYQMGIYDFRTSTMFVAPLTTIIILNMAALSVGVFRAVFAVAGDVMWAQMLLSSYILVVYYPITEAMFLRKDSGRILPSVTLLSAVFSVMIFLVGYVIFGF